jgi:hypothetical protein
VRIRRPGATNCFEVIAGKSIPQEGPAKVFAGVGQIDTKPSGIVNYGERRLCGERISTGFAESTINQVIAKRFVKKQQMRWTPPIADPSTSNQR